MPRLGELRLSGTASGRGSNFFRRRDTGCAIVLNPLRSLARVPHAALF